MKIETWQIEATEMEIKSILAVCQKQGIHGLGFMKIVSQAINCPKCGLVISKGDDKDI